MTKNATAKRFLAALACAMLALGLLSTSASPAYATDPIKLSGTTYTENPGEGFTFDVRFVCSDCPKNDGENCYVYPGIDDKGHSFEITDFSYTISGGKCSFAISASGSSCQHSNLSWRYETASWSYNCASPFQNPDIIGFVVKVPSGSDTNDTHFDDRLLVDLKRAKTAHQGDATCITASPCALCASLYTNPAHHDKAPSCEPTADKSAHVASYPCCGKVATEPHAFDASGFCACGVENIAPVGAVTVEGASWSKTWNAATPWVDGPYQLFCKDGASVTVRADGTGSEVAKVEYLLSEDALDVGSLPADGWTTAAEADGGYSFSIDPQSKGAVYVLITDACGNQAVISSERFVVYSDSEAITSEATYVRGSGENPAFEIGFNGNEVAHVLAGQTPLDAQDYVVTQTGIELLSSFVEGASLGDDPVFTVCLDPLGEQFPYDETGLGRAARAAVDVPSALTITLHIRDAWVPTESVDNVGGVTPDNVNLEDRTALEKAREDLEAALGDEGKNYTDESKSAIEEDLARVNGALGVIEDVEEVERLINALPETITAGDSAAVNAAEEAYSALSEHGKSLVSEDARARLLAAEEKLEEALTAEESRIAATGDTLLAVFAAFAMMLAAAGVLVAHRKMRGVI